MTVVLGKRTPLPFLWLFLTHDNQTLTLQLSPLNYVCFSPGKTHGAKSNGQFCALVILHVSAALDKDDRGLVLETFSLSSSRIPYFPGLCQLHSFLSLLFWIFWMFLTSRNWKTQGSILIFLSVFTRVTLCSSMASGTIYPVIWLEPMS